ncbi:hypothetical protein GCM10027610_073650 [Dactylosporangium cerinum]
MENATRICRTAVVNIRPPPVDGHRRGAARRRPGPASGQDELQVAKKTPAMAPMTYLVCFTVQTNRDIGPPSSIGNDQ